MRAQRPKLQRVVLTSMRQFMSSGDFRALEDGKLPDGVLAVAWQPLHLKAGATVDGNAAGRAHVLTKAVVDVVSDIEVVRQDAARDVALLPTERAGMPVLRVSR